MSSISNSESVASARLDFRISASNKQTIERAANLQGQSVSSFALATLLEAAERIVENASSRTLSARDSEKFLSLLSGSDEPNTAMKSAAARYNAAREASRGA